MKKNSTFFSNFLIEKITCTNFCNFFLWEFYERKFAKNVQKFLLIRLNAVDFFRFFQLLIEVKNAKNEICIISDNSSNMAAIRLKICIKQSWGKCLRILDTRSHLGWRSILHGNPARPFGTKRRQWVSFNQKHRRSSIGYRKIIQVVHLTPFYQHLSKDQRLSDKDPSIQYLINSVESSYRKKSSKFRRLNSFNSYHIRKLLSGSVKFTVKYCIYTA